MRSNTATDSFPCSSLDRTACAATLLSLAAAPRKDRDQGLRCQTALRGRRWVKACALVPRVCDTGPSA